MNKLSLFSLMALATMALVLAQPSAAAACNSGCGRDKGQVTCGQNAVSAALEAKDYEAWKKAVAGKPCQAQSKVTKENFAILVKIHELKKAGKFDEAAALEKSSGLTTSDNKASSCGCAGKKDSANLQGKVVKPTALHKVFGPLSMRTR